MTAETGERLIPRQRNSRESITKNNRREILQQEPDLKASGEVFSAEAQALPVGHSSFWEWPMGSLQALVSYRDALKGKQTVNNMPSIVTEESNRSTSFQVWPADTLSAIVSALIAKREERVHGDSEFEKIRLEVIQEAEMRRSKNAQRQRDRRKQYRYPTDHRIYR